MVINFSAATVSYRFVQIAVFLGGGAPEMEVAVKLRNLAQTKQGAEQYCWKVGF
jgi:chaperonin GroEL (HSP60 family)